MFINSIYIKNQKNQTNQKKNKKNNVSDDDFLLIFVDFLGTLAERFDGVKPTQICFLKIT